MKALFTTVFQPSYTLSTSATDVNGDEKNF